MTTSVLSCPKCRAMVHLREGESTVQCTACGATVVRPPTVVTVARPASPGGGRQGVLALSLMFVAVGFGTMAFFRHPPRNRSTVPAAPTAVFTPPVAPPVVPTPEGDIAWDAHARAPVVTAINGDQVEDVFGFFHVWDGRSAWVAYAGAFDGATLKPLWRTEPIDPQLVKRPGVVPLAVVAGTRLVVADTSPVLRIFDLATGAKQATLKLDNQVVDACRSPDSPNRVWVSVAGGPDVTVDLVTTKAEPAPRPKWCPERLYENTTVPVPSRKPSPEVAQAIAKKTAEVVACIRTFENPLLAQATCRSPGASTEPGFVARYELTDGANVVELGTKSDRPMAVSTTKASAWTHAFVPGDVKAKEGPPFVADLAQGRLYAVTERKYFDAQLAAIDAHTGKTLWEAPLLRTLPATDGSERGVASGLVATAARVYVAREGGALDVFDATTGKPLGTIGKQ